MKILNNKEEWGGPLCNCNNRWPYIEDLPGVINIFGYNQSLYTITDKRSPDKGKELVFFKGEGTCQKCGMVRWRVRE